LSTMRREFIAVSLWWWKPGSTGSEAGRMPVFL
jgi:hypothetical protein